MAGVPQPTELENKSALELASLAPLGDLVLRCGHKVWVVHKAILANKSPWFRQALVGAPNQQGPAGLITIEEFSPAEIESLLEYIYGMIDDNTWARIRGGRSMAQFSMALYDLSDFFEIDELRSYSHRVFVRHLISFASDFQLYAGPYEVDAEEIIKIFEDVYGWDDRSPAVAVIRPVLGMVFSEIQYRLEMGDFRALCEIPGALEDKRTYELEQQQGYPPPL
ncbi:hypothetical protein F4777DRAFT_601779 [Nemania sp. FL0916]|nr:hypothetical protein F4777DRAFT_601779 [Nemania sp. FL0916]